MIDQDSLDDQNDLNEYFSLLDFCNPGFLGTKMDFHKNYENPICKGRDGLATEKEQEVGDLKLKELNEKVSKFMIRRTNDLLSKYRTSLVPCLGPLGECADPVASPTNSPRQVRARRLLRPLALPARSLSVLYHLVQQEGAPNHLVASHYAYAQNHESSGSIESGGRDSRMRSSLPAWI